MKNNCMICFETLSEKSFSCSKNCNGKVCETCLCMLISHSVNHSVVPSCPTVKCNGEYFISNFPKSFDETREKYSNICFDILSGIGQKTLVDKEISQKIIENLRKEKINFLDNFPISVKNVAQIALKKKLNKINNNNLKKVQGVLTTTTSKCFALFCDGKLLADGSCILCKKKFCLECEKLIENSTHKCNEEDISSVQAVKSFVKCPQCLIPVIRSWGCDNMTCPVCKINFSYTTGKRVVDGNHQNITIKLKKTFYDDISEKYKNKEALEILMKIQNKKPNTPRIDTFLKKYKANPDKAIKLAPYKYEEIKQAEIKMETYFKILEYITNSSENLSNEELLALLELL